jgi:hypothetical protein
MDCPGYRIWSFDIPSSTFRGKPPWLTGMKTTPCPSDTLPWSS